MLWLRRSCSVAVFLCLGFVFNGRTEITGTVGEDVVVFNGDDLATRWNLYDITFGGRFAWWLAYTVSTL